MDNEGEGNINKRKLEKLVSTHVERLHVSVYFQLHLNQQNEKERKEEK